MICCVRSANFAADCVGNASASSMLFVCSDCVPPKTAARACSVTRTTLFSGSCAVRVEPPVCVWKRISHDFSDAAHDLRPQLARRAELGDLFEKIVVCVPEERHARSDVIWAQAGLQRRAQI